MTADKFFEELKKELAEFPEVVAKMAITNSFAESGVDVLAEIPADGPDGFKITIQFQKDYEINVIADECMVDFFLTDKERDFEKNENAVRRAFDLVRRLLGPQCRVHNYCRGGLLYKSHVEREQGGKWVQEAVYRRVLWGARFFGKRSEMILQNGMVNQARQTVG